MLQYIKNILPRLQQFSKDLDTRENFTEKRWVMLDTDNNTHEYFFKKDGKLLLFINGDGKQGTWELLDGGKRIVVEVNNEIKLLQSAFIQDGLFVLKKSASEELAFALYNPAVITDGDIERYIEQVLGAEQVINGGSSPKPIENFGSVDFETDQGKITVLFSGNIKAPVYGDSVVFHGSSNTVTDGTYNVINNKEFRSIRILNGKISEYRLIDEGTELVPLLIIFAIAAIVILFISIVIKSN